MGWVRVSDDFYDHPKFADVNPLSIALWLGGLAYCNRNLTDGVIPESAASRLLDFDGVPAVDCAQLAVKELLRAGLWHGEGHDCRACPQPGPRRMVVHDYLEYQPSKVTVTRKREAAKARMTSVRGARRQAVGSQEVRANIERSSQEVRLTPTPTPTPTPRASKNSSPAATRPEAFEAFWDAYPRKEGRGAAAKALQAALRKEDPIVVLAGLKRQLPKLQATERRFIPMPATWLNQERWTDAVQPTNGHTPASRPAGIPEAW